MMSIGENGSKKGKTEPDVGGGKFQAAKEEGNNEMRFLMKI